MKTITIVGCAILILFATQVKTSLEPGNSGEVALQSKYPPPPTSKMDALDPWPRFASEMLV